MENTKSKQLLRFPMSIRIKGKRKTSIKDNVIFDIQKSKMKVKDDAIINQVQITATSTLT